MNANELYGLALISQPKTRLISLAIMLVGVAISLALCVYLSVPWTDVGLGILAGTGLSAIAGFVVGIAVVKLDVFGAYYKHVVPINIVLGAGSTIIGIGLFAGLAPALLVVVTPMLLTVPATFALRRWAISQLDLSTL